jgi:RNA polymerase sigma-70 factor (ECF subfamily)
MYSNSSDEELIEKISKSKDNLAFEEIYSRYKTPIYNYIDRLTFDKDVVDDLFQNVFIKVYEKASKFKKGYKLKSWIYRISTNEYIDYLRKVKRKNLKIELKEDITVKDDSVDLEKIIYNKEMLECFYSALDALSSPFKEAFIMKMMDGLSFEECSDVLNISQRSVKNYLEKAKTFIKSFIKSRGF